MPSCRLLLCCVICAAAWSQEFRATLTGRVTDAQNASIPNAKITATLVSTGSRSETTTNADGGYTIPFLAPGAYRLEVEANSFKRYVRSGLDVAAGERVAVDVQLEIGAVTESVNVTAEVPLLENASATSGQVFDSKQIEDIPLNGRTPLVLAQLAFGVVPNTDPRFNRPFDNAGPSGISMGGAPAQNNELLVDGAPGTTWDLRVSYNPPVDAVAEVRVHAFEADAAYGHTGGGTANVILKSGTNTFHGSAYEFNQNSATSAVAWGSHVPGQVVPASRYNQYGFSVGGPWIIPKILNGRNKAFWFFALEDLNDSFSEGTTVGVPTAAERKGDFSALLAAGKVSNGVNNYQIFNPFSGVLTNGHVNRQPFAGNVIPSSLMLSPIAQAYLKYWPMPNVAGNPDGSLNYSAGNEIRADTYNGQLGRLDFNMGEKHKLFWDFRHNDRIENRLNVFNNPASGRDLLRINLGSTLDYVYTVTPTMVANIKVNWTHFREANVSFSDGVKATDLGFPSYLTSNSPNLIIPRLAFNGDAGPPGGCVCFYGIGRDQDSNSPFNIFSIFGDVVKIKGNHSLKMGGDVREYRRSNVSYGDSQGRFDFNSNWTRGPQDNSAAAPFGQDFAAFMLGLPTGGDYQLNAFSTTQSKFAAVFLQDDWRVRSNLTINVGIRFEHEFPTTERFNRGITGFDGTATSPIAAAAIAAYAKSPITQVPVGSFLVPGGLTFAGTGNNSPLYSTDSRIFSPRFGFAWTPGGANRKTVLRGGFGMFVAPLVGSGNHGAGPTSTLNQPGFSASSSVVASLDSMVTPYATFSNPFPAGISQPTGSSLGLATFLGQGITFFNPHVRNPYSIRWNFDIQRQLPFNSVFELAYIGNHAVHLAEGSTAQNSDNINLNYVPGKYLSTEPIRDAAMNATNSLLTGAVTNPFAGLIPGQSLNGSTVSLQTLLKPFPEFGNISQQLTNGGSSYFHSLDVRLEKKTHGLFILANFTYSKLIEQIRLLNDFNTAPEKRVATDDRPLRFVATGLYELPIGKGKLLHFQSTWANRLVGGWMVGGIYTNQLGQPLGWGDVIYLGGPLRYDPHQVRGLAFDITRFDRVSGDQVVSHVRSFPTQFSNLRQDGANNLDVSLIKNTPLSERINFQLRAEAFNATNRTEFNAPNLSPTAGSFGTITTQANNSRQMQFGARLTW